MFINKKLSIVLTVIIIMLSTIACLGGIFWDSLYRDNEFVTSVWTGNDLITLLLAIPTAVIALIYANKRSIKALFIWIGVLWYMIYNYVFYMYGAAFNKFFLIYVFIFILSAIAFILLIVNFSKEELKKAIMEDRKVPVRRISAYLLFFATFIGLMWIVMSLSFVFTDVVPLGVTQTDHPTGVVFATDLSFLATPLIFGALLLWRKNYWGFVISTIIMTKCILYPLVLMVGGIMAYRSTGQWDFFIPLYVALGVGCFICLLYLLKGLKPVDPKLL